MHALSATTHSLPRHSLPRRRLLVATASTLDGSLIDDRYRVIRQLGQGAVGIVYEGEHEAIGRRVAIKVLHDNWASSPTIVARFEREARVAGSIGHPNIVEVLDFGRLPWGSPYLVMEYLEGRDLGEAMGIWRFFSIAETIAWLAPVASALDASHQSGVIHRDVKPGNILRAATPNGYTVKLVDFGLASLRDVSSNKRLTRAGAVLGTPHYISPEAAEGRAVDARSDVYSLACVAFEMLSGGVPHPGNVIGAVLRSKLMQRARTLSEASGGQFAPMLELLFARALSRNPAHRPASATELIDALSRT